MWHWSLSHSYPQCPCCAARWSLCTGTIFSLPLAQFGPLRENCVHSWNIRQQRWKKKCATVHILFFQEEKPHAITEKTFPVPFLGDYLVPYYRKPAERTVWAWRPLDRLAVPALLTGRAAAAVTTCASGSQAGDVAAARWRTHSFCSHCLPHSTLSTPFGRPRVPVAWPARSPDLTFMDYFLAVAWSSWGMLRGQRVGLSS